MYWCWCCQRVFIGVGLESMCIDVGVESICMGVGVVEVCVLGLVLKV